MSIIFFFAISLQYFCLFKSFLSISAGLYSLLSHHHPENPSWVLSLALDGKRGKESGKVCGRCGQKKERWFSRLQERHAFKEENKTHGTRGKRRIFLMSYYIAGMGQ